MKLICYVVFFLFFLSFFFCVYFVPVFFFLSLSSFSLPSLLFLLPFAWMIFMPLIKAIAEPIGKNVGKAVKAGVIALIIMNAAWATVFGQYYLAGIILLLLPVSIGLAKAFAVT